MKNAYYKYRPLYRIGTNGQPEAHPFTQSIFQKAEIWYSAPTDFNDPFDCNIRLHVNDSTDAEWEDYYEDLIAFDPSRRKGLEKAKSEKRWKTKPAIRTSLGVEQHKRFYVESSVFCLSKKNNSTPMFSYYADGHQGIAIEFSFSYDEIPCGVSFIPTGKNDKVYNGNVLSLDVEYPSLFPELNFHRIRKDDRLLRHLLFTKAREWSHEQEFRIFRINLPKSSVSFDRRLITKIIFGCKTTSVDVDLVKIWLKNWPSDVVLSKAEPATDRFELLIKDFDVVKGS